METDPVPRGPIGQVKRLLSAVDPSSWFTWSGRDDGPPTPPERFVQVGVDEQGRKLWAGPLY
jgi:hypothetical protein